jgi:hypothetical protein
MRSRIASIPKNASAKKSVRNIRVSPKRAHVVTKYDEADIALSERLILHEKPVPLHKVLKEFGRTRAR